MKESEFMEFVNAEVWARRRVAVAEKRIAEAQEEHQAAMKALSKAASDRGGAYARLLHALLSDSEKPAPPPESGTKAPIKIPVVARAADGPHDTLPSARDPARGCGIPWSDAERLAAKLSEKGLEIASDADALITSVVRQAEEGRGDWTRVTPTLLRALRHCAPGLFDRYVVAVSRRAA